MSSIFSFLRRGEPAPLPAPLPAPVPAATRASAAAEALAAVTLPPMPIHNGPPAPEAIIAELLNGLKVFLPSAAGSLPDPGVSLITIADRPTGLGNHIGQEAREQFSVALKGGRLQAVVRFQLWGDGPNAADTAVDALHGRLLAAKDALRAAGFLRVISTAATLAEEIASLDGWRKTADYQVLYEYRYTDADGAQSLIARIPIHTDPEEPDSPERETAVVTDALVRWDQESAPRLSLVGRQAVARLSLLAFVPAAPPGGAVSLIRTFDGATGTPTSYPDLSAFLTAVTDTAVPERHGQVTFADLNDFLAAFSSTLDPILLGDWDEDGLTDSYEPGVLAFAPPISLSEASDRLQLVYQPGSTDPKLDQVAVIYIRAGTL